MKTNYALRIAVACLLGGIAPSAFADVEWAGAPATFATEEGTVGAAQSLTIGNLSKIPIIGGKTIIGGSVFYYVKLTLTGGATFESDVDNADKLQCYYDGTTLGPAVGINVPGKDKDQVTYLLNAGTLGSNPTCTLPELKIKINSGQKEYGLQAYVNVNTLEGSQNQTNSMSLATFAQALSIKTTQVTDNKVTVDVRSPSLSKGFAANGGAANYTALTTIGAISYANGSSVKRLLDGQNATPLDYISKLSITVSGLPLAAASEASGQVRSGYAYLGRMVGTDPCANGYSSNAAVAAADFVTVSGGSVTLEITDPTGTNLNLLNGTPAYVCIKTNGATTLPKGTVKYSVVATAQGGKQPNTVATNNELATFVKNGASIKVLNIPGPLNAVDSSFIRIYNMSDAEATVYGTMYDQGKTDATTGIDTGGGTILGTESMVLGKIPAKGTLVLSPNPQNSSTVNLKTLVGKDWDGKAWMQIESDVRQLRVQALIRTGGAGGVTVNVSERVKADGEFLFRSDED